MFASFLLAPSYPIQFIFHYELIFYRRIYFINAIILLYYRFVYAVYYVINFIGKGKI